MTPVYLDCNASTPLDPEVQQALMDAMRESFGNAGSRTHAYGARAKQAVERARDQIATVVKCRREEVIFTSGATESDNLALLGLREYGERSQRRHIVATAIEHKAVLEPLEYLGGHGFEITLVSPERDGVMAPQRVVEALRPDTLLVSIMHVNNETGAIQPVQEIAAVLREHSAFFHVDAAQGFGKRIVDLQDPRIDLISVSGHKVFAPQGIGALIARRRGYERIPLTPLAYGGGQERGLRPGTLPVPLIVAFGKAAELALRDADRRNAICQAIKEEALVAFRKVGASVTVDLAKSVANTLNVSIPGADSEAVMLAVRDVISISNGSACTSQSYTPSHVLTAMGLSSEHIKGAIRLSWCHLTPKVDWENVLRSIQALRS